MENKIELLLSRFPAVALTGPRQIGKTTLARKIAEKLDPRSVYLDLELPSNQAKLSDPELYFHQHENHLVVLDEIHHVPRIFEVLRGVIDQRRRKGQRTGQFLLLGSASLDLSQKSSESLAGRVAYQELASLSIEEVEATNRDATETLWLRGGFPDSFLADDDEASYNWRTQFIKTYLERDVPALGPRIPAETLRRYWQMLAHNQSQMMNAAQIATGLGMSGQTVVRYLGIMEDLFLVRRLHPWSSNSSKRLVKSPKIYVRDTGLLHALLGIEGFEDLLGNPILGASWEGFIIENILDLTPSEAEPSFYRTSAGAEIDLILKWKNGERWAIEIKRSLRDPKPQVGFYNGCRDIKATKQIVIYPGQDTYWLDEKTQVMGVERFTPLLHADQATVKRKRSTLQ